MPLLSEREVSDQSRVRGSAGPPFSVGDPVVRRDIASTIRDEESRRIGIVSARWDDGVHYYVRVRFPDWEYAPNYYVARFRLATEAEPDAPRPKPPPTNHKIGVPKNKLP